LLLYSCNGAIFFDQQKKHKKDGTITFEEMCQVVAGMEKSKKVLFFLRHHHLGGNVARVMEQSNKVLYYTSFLAFYY
jgi:hypothetical protein